MKTNHVDCINKVREEIKKADPRITGVMFQLATITDGKKGNMTGQPLIIFYNHKKKDGTTIEKQEKSFIAHEYCPFCGKKY